MSPSIEITPDLMAGFLDEAPEYLQMLDESLLAFETKADCGTVALDGEEDRERMNVMFRAAHSLKGLAAAMGFDRIRDLTHLMETLFDHIRMGKRPFEAASFEALFSVFDKLRELIEELAVPQDEPVSIDEALRTLETILASEPGGSTQTDSAGAASAPEGTSAPATDASAATGEAPGSDPVSSTDASRGDSGGPDDQDTSVLDDPDMVRLFLETTGEAIESLNENLLELEKAPDDLDRLNEVFRCAHNIKGATGTMGLEVMFRLTHDMETVLDQLRSAKLKLDAELIDVLLSANDRLRSDLDLVRSGKTEGLAHEDTHDWFVRWLAPSGSDAEQDQASDPGAAGVTPDSQAQSAQMPNNEHPDAPSGATVVTVRFPKGSIESPIQAYLIRNKLDGIGEVLSTVPDVEALDPEAVLEQVVYEIDTPAPSDQIRELVSIYNVDCVTVESPATEDHEPEETPNAAPDPVESVAPIPAPPPAPSGRPAPAVDTERPVPTENHPPAQPSQKPSAPEKPSAPAPVAAGKGPQAAPAKVGETIRVDLERLDQLMNLGGELVISKARLFQIHSILTPLLSGKNFGYMVENMADGLAKLNDEVSMLGEGEDVGRLATQMQSALRQVRHDFDEVKQLVGRVNDTKSAMHDFTEALHSLNRISEGMQKRIMETRMVHIGPLFGRFRRVVRDICKATGKSVSLTLHGENTELDKRMIDELGDPLTHMVRNSIDHGIEPPEQREAVGKPRSGQVVMEAYHSGRFICIEVRDDGRGIDTVTVRRKLLEREVVTAAQLEQMSEKEVCQYVFHPGLSTAEQVSDLSGRGMGMDIVKAKIEKISGTVDIESEPGKGTRVLIKLPLTLAIITSLISRVGKGIFAVPLDTVAEIITVRREDIQHIQRRKVVRLRDRVYPVAFFEDIFQTKLPHLQTCSRHDAELTLVILGVSDEKIALVVDEMVGQEDVVIKSLSANYRNIAGVSGASIMGDGRVSLILDVNSMMTMFAEAPAPAPVELEADAPATQVGAATLT